MADSVEYRSIARFPKSRVGDDGSVWSCRRWRSYPEGIWRRLKPVPCKARGGYLKVTLTAAGGRRIQVYVHQLVLEAFVGPCPPGLEALHDDGKPANNRRGNLRWGTRVENAADTKRHGRHFTPFAKVPSISPAVVRELRRRNEAGESTRVLAASTGLNYRTVGYAIAGHGAYGRGEYAV